MIITLYIGFLSNLIAMRHTVFVGIFIEQFCVCPHQDCIMWLAQKLIYNIGTVKKISIYSCSVDISFTHMEFYEQC